METVTIANAWASIGRTWMDREVELPGALPLTDRWWG